MKRSALALLLFASVAYAQPDHGPPAGPTVEPLPEKIKPGDLLLVAEDGTLEIVTKRPGCLACGFHAKRVIEKEKKAKEPK